MYGRECATWLPAIIMGNNGNFTNVTDLKSSAITSYGNDSNPYSKTIYEASPLNRVLEQYGPGANWHSSNSSNKVSYLTNDATGNRSCMYFKIDGSGLNASLVKSGLYAAGELYVTEKKNEIGNLSYEFKNSLEQTILIRQMNNNEAHDTYYVYDDFGNLNYVIPPILADKIIKENKSMADNSLEVKQYAYLYKYDERNRCIRKRLPGCDWIYYVYDRTDRLIFTQDGESRKKHEWIYSIPDALGRIVQTGTCRNTDISNENYKDKLVIGTYNVEKGYSFSDFIPENRRYFMNNYYDNYDFLTDRNKELVYEDRPGYGKRYNVNDYSAKGLLTGTYVNTIPAGWEGALDEHSALYYDDRGRLIQSRKSRMSGEAFDNEYLAYNFQGQPVKRLHEHLMTDINQTSELYSYEYDHAGRLIETRHKLNERNEVVIARNTYDELGRLISEQANGQEGLQTDYSYNIRSWTTNLNNSVYRESIEYNNIGNVIYMNEYRHSKRPQYYWEVSMEYDDLSRMTSYADAGYGAAPTTFFEYDKHGNIIYIDRSGVTAEDSYDSCDELTITHSGNQVQSVVDATDCSETYYSYDFRNLTGVGTSASYEYDLNGAVTKDPYKGATIINNSLNLPQQITVNNNLASGSITYVYLATGEKIMASSSVSLRRSLNPAEIAGGVSTMASTDRDEATFYFGNIIYKTTPEGEPYLDKILIDNGYIKDGEYYFYIKDHLGNNRATAFSTGSVKGMDDYFPYGMPVIDSKWGKNPQAYRFGGKELERLMGLNLYDFQARWHDPALGRFMSVDPLCEKYYSISPYAYCANNPINAIDLRGDSITYIINSTMTNPNGTTSISSSTYYYGQDANGNYGFIGSNGQVYSGNDTYLNNLTTAINNLRVGGNVGNTLVSDLMSSTNRVQIVRGNNTADINGAFIKWNPNSTAGGINAIGSENRPSYIGLGHEMAHIQDVWNGTIDNSTWVTAGGVAIPNSEKYATHIENQLRAENGILLRTHYGIDASTGTRVGLESTRIVRGVTSLFYWKSNGIAPNGIPLLSTPFIYRRR